MRPIGATRPLTKAERVRQEEAIKQAQQLPEQMLASRSGKPLASSAELIAQSREERSKQV